MRGGNRYIEAVHRFQNCHKSPASPFFYDCKSTSSSKLITMASPEGKNPALAEGQTLPDSPKSEQHGSNADFVLDPKAERKLLYKLDFCIYPTLFIIYMMSFLDRINISNARIQGMDEDLNLYGDRFNIALFVSLLRHLDGLQIANS